MKSFNQTCFHAKNTKAYDSSAELLFYADKSFTNMETVHAWHVQYTAMCGIYSTRDMLMISLLNPYIYVPTQTFVQA